jgi:tetratricopeptide (TPR) repeat protein
MRILTYLVSVILALVLCSASVGNDYFNRITMVSDGRITRFPNIPISVYIEAPTVPDIMQHAYVGDVEYALDQWAGCSEGLLKFEIVDSEDADIRVYWTREPLSGEADPLGEASLVRFDSGKFYVEVYVMVQERPSVAKPMHKRLKAVLLHELGHAIGLWGHSRDHYDIMYPKSTTIQPTRKDKSTLLKLLKSRPGLPLHDIAIAELKSDISANPDTAYLHFWLGTVYADSGEEDLAIEELLTALRLSPNLMKAAHRLGRIFQKEGMYGKAIAYYSREVDLEPSPGLYGMIGMLHLRQEKYNEAIEYFEKALRMDSDFLAAETDMMAAYHLWASQLIKDSRIDEALSILARAVEVFPSSRVIHYDIGTAYDTSGQYEKAIEQYKKTLEIEPSFVAAKSNIAGCMNSLGAEQMQSKNWGKSIELCKHALEWDTEFWEARENLESATLELGREKHKAGLVDEAIMHYRSVMEMNPENVDASSNLGFALYDKGLCKEALAQFQTTLEIDPNSHDARVGLAVVKRYVNITRAKIAILATFISMLLCISIISLVRYKRRGKRSQHQLVEESGEL